MFNMRFCKITFAFPFKETPTSGLAAFMPSCSIDSSTLFITPFKGEPSLQVPEHISITAPKLFTQPLWNNLSSHTWLKRLSQILYLGEFSLRCLRPAVAFRPDVTVTYGNSSVLSAIIIKLLCRCRIVLSLHNMTEIELIARSSTLRMFVKRFDAVLVVSNAMKKKLLAAIPSLKVVFRPTGIDTELFKPLGTPRLSQIITVGSFKWKKGYPYLLDAMWILTEKFPEYKLVIVGDGVLRPQIEKKISNLNLEKHVELRGALPHRDLIPLLCQSRIFVLASLKEGTPKTAIEALACETPVVVTEACALTEYINEVGVEVPSGDAERLAEALSALIDDVTSWQAYSNNARKVAKQFSWASVARVEKEAIKELLRLKKGI